MWPYWMMFLLPATAAVLENSMRPPIGLTATRPRVWDGIAVCTAAALALLVGFRDGVGGDWGAYVRHFEEIQGSSLAEALTLTDPGYALLNWTIA
jgi:hypothetical protein